MTNKSTTNLNKIRSEITILRLRYRMCLGNWLCQLGRPRRSVVWDFDPGEYLLLLCAYESLPDSDRTLLEVNVADPMAHDSKESSNALARILGTWVACLLEFGREFGGDDRFTGVLNSYDGGAKLFHDLPAKVSRLRGRDAVALQVILEIGHSMPTLFAYHGPNWGPQTVTAHVNKLDRDRGVACRLWSTREKLRKLSSRRAKPHGP